MSKEQDLDCNREASMKGQNNYEHDSGSFGVGGGYHWVARSSHYQQRGSVWLGSCDLQVPEQECSGESESHGCESIVENCPTISTTLHHPDCRWNLLLSGLQLTNATGIQIKFAYPYSAQHSSKFALSLPNHFNTAHNPRGTNTVYPYTSPAAPDSNLKSYAKCCLPSVAR